MVLARVVLGGGGGGKRKGEWNTRIPLRGVVLLIALFYIGLKDIK